MNKRHFISQTLLLLVALVGLGMIVVGVFSFDDTTWTTPSHPLEFLGAGLGYLGGLVLAVMMAVFGFIVLIIFIWLWRRRQKRLLAAAEESGTAAPETAFRDFLKQIGTLFAVIFVLLIAYGQWEDWSRKAQRDQQFREEHPEGPFTLYHSNGQKMVEGRYDHNGLIQGPVTVWYTHGQKKYEGSVIDGEGYEQYGRGIYELHADTAYDGRSVHWHMNGKIKSEEFHADGKLEGRSVSWHFNGQMKSEEFHAEGRAEGLNRSWWQDGTLESERDYKPDGTATWKLYYPNGQQELEMKFVNTHLGNANSFPEQWRNVRLAGRHLWGANGQPHGTWTRWYATGQIWQQTTWMGGKQHGRFIVWWSNGEKRLEENYVNGRKVDTTSFDEEGNLVPQD